MSLTRRWSLLTAVLIVGILAASWFLLVSPKRSAAADLRNQVTQQDSDNASLVQKLNQLKAQSLDLPKQKAQLAVFGKEIPDNPALPALIRDLTAAAKKVGVDLMSMRPGTPIAVTVTAPVPVAAAATTTSGTGTSTGTDGAAAAAAPTTVAHAAAPLYVVSLSLDVTGSYFEAEQFINKLEGMQRKFLLTSFSLKPGGGATTPGSTTAAPGTLSLALVGQVFLSPNLASSTPAAAPVAAAQ